MGWREEVEEDEGRGVEEDKGEGEWGKQEWETKTEMGMFLVEEIV